MPIESFWTAFCRRLRDRWFFGVQFLISDVNARLKNAIDRRGQLTTSQRYRIHHPFVESFAYARNFVTMVLIGIQDIVLAVLR